MLRFQNIEFLYGLLIIPILILIFWWTLYQKKKSLQKFGELKLLSNLLTDPSKNKPIIKFILISLSLAFLILGLANLQVGLKLEEVKREGLDIIFAIDVSNSMRAEDIKPNRLESAKQSISRLIEKLRDDRIGIIVFAGDAYLQLPLTPDYSAAKLFVDAINYDIVPIQGTAIGSAIKLAMRTFSPGEKKHKVLIIITDGENHEDDAIGETKNAVNEGIVIHTIGIGSPLGSPIPVYQNNTLVGYKKDKEGNIVITKLDEIVLQQIASIGGGKYFSATSHQQELENIFTEIAAMEKKEYSAKIFTDYEDQFQYFLLVALILLTIEFFISDRRNKLISRFNLFGERK